MNCGNLLRDLITNLSWKYGQGDMLTTYQVKTLSIGKSAAKSLKAYKSMGKVQRIDIEVMQPIIYPRASDAFKAKIYASLSGNMQKYSLNGYMIIKTKLTQRDCDIALGLFAPERFELDNYKGYDIVKLQDHFRSLKILKYRNGIANVRIGLFFDGATSSFEELPVARQMSDEDYFLYRARVGLEDPNQQHLNFSNS